MPTTAPTSTDAAPRVRKDVARNRAHLLRTADALIAERGLGITFHELAAAAGVGVGTVYRHFADRDALLGALIEGRFGAAQDILLAAEQVEDPVVGLRQAILSICQLQHDDRGIFQAMLSDAETHRDIARERLLPITERIVARAVATGRVRADFRPADLPMIFLLSGTLGQQTRGVRPDLWRRYVSALLDGFMTSEHDRTGPGVGPPTENDIERTIVGA